MGVETKMEQHRGTTDDSTADVHVTEETGALLTALNNLDETMVEVMLGLLEDTLSADEQVRFGRMFTDVGTLLERRAEGEQQQAVPEGRVARTPRQSDVTRHCEAGE